MKWMDIKEMTVRKVNPAVRVIDARRCNEVRRNRDTRKATAAWTVRTFERNRPRYEATLKLILAGKTYKEIAEELGYSYTKTTHFVYQYDLPRPVRKTKKGRK